jgi:hypothetical protein
MGCSESRDKNDEEEIELLEKRLQFPNFTIGQIKEGFFQATGSSVVTRAQIEKAVEHLGIQYSPEDKEIFNRFLSAFFSFDEEGVEYYELNLLLTALFIMSKSSQNEKSSSLFDLYDDNYSNSLSRLEADTAFCRICDVVFLYSEKILDNDESMSSLHESIMQKKRDEVIPKVHDFFFEAKEEISRDQFLKLISLAALSQELFDFTSPKSIRSGLMEFLFQGRLTQVQLQQHYGIRKSTRGTSAFIENDGDRTSDNSPLYAPRAGIKKE